MSYSLPIQLLLDEKRVFSGLYRQYQGISVVLIYLYVRISGIHILRSYNSCYFVDDGTGYADQVGVVNWYKNNIPFFIFWVKTFGGIAYGEAWFAACDIKMTQVIERYQDVHG